MADSKTFITSDELRSHSTPGDLWISIHGKIYDVSDWSKIHPGGDQPLLHLSGQDATDAFVAFHPASAWTSLSPLSTGLHLQDHSVSDTSKDYRNLVRHFTNLGLYDKKGHVTFATASAAFLLLAASVALVLLRDGFLPHLLSGCLMGLCWIQSGWIGHDSGHHPVMPTPLLNRLAQILSGNCLAGISIAWWKWNHNAHHIACNSLDHDPDLQHIPFLAVSPKFFSSITSQFYNRRLPFNRISKFLIGNQHFTFYPVMCLARINLFAQSFALLLSDRKVPHRVQELIGLLVFWIWYPLLISYLPTWAERVAFVGAGFSVTGIQHVQFCLNHFSTSVYVGPPKGNDWFEKQTSGTLDIDCPSWMDWFHGGLQFQTAHHLFPRLPRGQLRKVSPLVRELCKKHGLTYNRSSFWEANVRTIATLRKAAMEARNLVWEAVNTHG